MMQPITQAELTDIVERSRKGEDLEKRRPKPPVFASYFHRRNELIQQFHKHRRQGNGCQHK